MVIFKGKHTAFLTTDIPRVEELGKYVARFWLILIWRACLFKANVNNFPKKRTQAITSTVNYCPIGNSSALELSEKIASSVFWDGGGVSGESPKATVKWQVPAYWQAAGSERQDCVWGETGSVLLHHGKFYKSMSLPHTWHFNILLTDIFSFTLYHLPMKTYKLIYSIQFFHHQNLCFPASLFPFIHITCFLDFACRLSLWINIH